MAKVNTYTHVFRFAPSPNGYLHLGHAYSALLNYDMARETGGRLLLRIGERRPEAQENQSSKQCAGTPKM